MLHLLDPRQKQVLHNLGGVILVNTSDQKLEKNPPSDPLVILLNAPVQ